jgi:hypothetical protein
MLTRKLNAHEVEYIEKVPLQVWAAARFAILMFAILAVFFTSFGLFITAAHADGGVVDAGAALAAPSAAAVADAEPAELFKSFVDALRQSRWGFAVGFGVMLLTWVVRFTLLRDRIPTKYLPWLAIGLGLAADVSFQVGVGVVWWEALLSGLTHGSAAAGLWSAVGKHVMSPSAADPNGDQS